MTGLQTALGAQRSELVMKAARSWLARQFSNFAEEPKVISVARHGNGTFNVSLGAAGGTYMSVGGPRSIENYVPEHLIHHFDHLRGEKGGEGAY